MSELLLVNPRRRRRRKTSSKRRRKGRMPAGLRRYWAARRAGKSAAPKRRRSRRRVHRNPVAVSAPRRHRRRRHHVARRRYRRNPMGGGIVNSAISAGKCALMGAGGAIVNDVVYGVLPLPATLKSGNIALATKAATAIAGGMLLSKVVGRSTAREMTVGALTVLIYTPLRTLISGFAPNLLGYYGAGYSLNDMPSSLSDMPSSLSRYLSGMGDSEANPITNDSVGGLNGLGAYIN